MGLRGLLSLFLELRRRLLVVLLLLLLFLLLLRRRLGRRLGLVPLQDGRFCRANVRPRPRLGVGGWVRVPLVLVLILVLGLGLVVRLHDAASQPEATLRQTEQ